MGVSRYKLNAVSDEIGLHSVRKHHLNRSKVSSPRLFLLLNERTTMKKGTYPRNRHLKFQASEWLESRPETTGTLAWIVVPPFRRDSIESSPFTSLSRSRILARPSPPLFNAVSGSKPCPQSRTSK